MKAFLTLIITGLIHIAALAGNYSYSFNKTPLSEALIRLSKDNPEVTISFIYKELDNYTTSAKIETDDPYEALREIIGLNPISIIKKNNSYYIEALQHGKFRYSGRVVGHDNRPVIAATVMLLTPKDSTVITYGITDDAGRFSIPCDRQRVIAKLTCLGYKPTYRLFDTFDVGIIRMSELPIKLKGVNVLAGNAMLLSDKSIYRPSQRQKNASQTAMDLLARMAIPQINARLGANSVTTASGQPVAFYIDFVPASDNDLKMMNMSDIKSVEYLENPTDPRFQGNKNVINFRMTQYEYGGYVKTLASESFIANYGSIQTNARLVKKRMTYDIMGYAYYISNNHFGIDQIETFHLPLEDGQIKSFQRESTTESSKYRKQNYECSFRALYSTDKITANSLIAFSLDRLPHNDNKGKVEYSDHLNNGGNYSFESSQKAKYLNYSGYYFFNLPKDNSLSASLGYSYSHTDQRSSHLESQLSPIYNTADDNTHKGNAGVTYSHSFSATHSFMAHVRGIYENNRTGYRGSVYALDSSTTKFGQLGAAYNYSSAKLSASLGIGWNWLATRLNNNISESDYPYIDASLRYVPDKRNSFSSVFHYSVWPPSSNYKSENIIHISPFLWHTGNPMLKSHRSYDIWINYTFIPMNKFNINLFGGAWLVGNRAAFVYEATPDGIVRTIQQPIGTFRHYNYGINVSTNLLDNKFYLSGQLAQLYVQNGKPYNIDHSHISYYLQALYYLGNFNFAVSYQSAVATDNYNSMSGLWTRNKDIFIVQAGWSNGRWNFTASAQNLQRWDWCASYDTMNTPNYSVNRWTNNAGRHAFIQLSATYTFGYGKKINGGNDITRQAGASSGILK